jgi:gluconolactonase
MSRIKGMALARDGTLYACQTGSRRLIRFNADGSATPLPQRIDGHLHNYPDDLAVDRRGRIWFSDPYDNEPARGAQVQGPLQHASILRLERGPERAWLLSRVSFDTRAPHGVLLSPDERTLYVAETGDAAGEVRELRAYPIGDDGELGAYTVMHTFGADWRGPHRGIDGLCLDSDGNVLACAGWSQAGPGALIYVFAPSGRILETYPLPASMPVDCAFGDADLGTLYVTTDDGQLYRVRDTGRRGFAPCE